MFALARLSPRVPVVVIAPPVSVPSVATEVTVPEPSPPPTQVPLIAKQPAVKLIPPVDWNVEVAVVKFPIPWTERSEPGEVVPMPTEPEAVMTNCVVVPAPLFASASNNGIVALVEVACTVNRAVGDVVPIPTLPALLILIFSVTVDNTLDPAEVL